MRDKPRVTVQLQLGKEPISSKEAVDLSAVAALQALEALFKDGCNKSSKDTVFVKNFRDVINKAKRLVDQARAGHGLSPRHGKWQVWTKTFTHEKKEYHVDINCFGSEDTKFLA